MDEFIEPKPSNEFNLGRLRIMWWQDWTILIQMYHLPRDKRGFQGIELFRVHFERAWYKETFELNFALIGFNVCLEWYFGKRDMTIDHKKGE